MILQTTRLYLRELTQADFSQLCLILQDREVMYAYEHAFSIEEVQNWLDNQLKNYAKYGFGLWAVIDKKSDVILGQAGLTIQNCESEYLLEIGYLFKKAYWHQGYATEAAAGCKQYAFEALSQKNVHCIIRDTNISSQKVAERLGMVRGKEFIKHYYNMDMPHFLYTV